MKKNYAKTKRIKSLATRFLRTYDSLKDTGDLSDVYHADFMSFTEQLLIDLCGYKKEEPKPKTHRPRKIGTRPPKRKPCQRPLRIGERLDKMDPSQLATYDKKIQEEIEKTIDPEKPSWYKKAWRKVMMQVHPDRVDLVSSSDLDKLERLRIGSILKTDKDPELLIACCNKLESPIELNSYEQERLLRTRITDMDAKISSLRNNISWHWGESLIDNNVRKNIVKKVLETNGIQPPEEQILFDYILKNLP